MSRRPTERPGVDSGSLPAEQSRGPAGRRTAPASEEEQLPRVLRDPIVVKLVPISEDQLRVLESLERALASLYADFRRDVGEPANDVAGGLYRLTSALEEITRCWKEEAEDLATVEGRRTALAQITQNGLDGAIVRHIAGDAAK
jgi:hypothetical protein